MDRKVVGEENRDPLSDGKAREQIKTLLDRNILVEAAAGTGKTTGMMERMVALLVSGKCRTGTIAAVTFTRKAAAELRSRFQIALEKAASGAEGEEKENAERALSEIDRAFIGTIHSFCARLLRERPVEAGVDLEFSEIEEEDDMLLRSEAWQLYIAGLIADDPGGMVSEWERLGLNPDELESAFIKFANYPDIVEWPDACETGPSFSEEADRTERYAGFMNGHKNKLPRDAQKDKLIPKYKRIPRVVSHLTDLGDPRELYYLMLMFDANPGVVQRVWAETGNYEKEDARREKDRWDAFREETARPVIDAWSEARYPVVLKAFHQAKEIYDRMRGERGVLNFADLLMKAAALLRENAHVREYFQRRFTHLLVDEFQDTDPIQAEVMLLLTSSDPEETDYRNCAPKPGSLFVVGDPKQSIYRFRRADIEIYNEVKKVIEETGGLVVQLYTNFRSTGKIIDWVNDVFSPDGAGEGTGENGMLKFPGKPTAQSPSYIPLERAPGVEREGGFDGLYELVIPEENGKRELAVEYEADRIARTIRAAIDSGMTVTRTARELESGVKPQLDYSDFLIISRNKKDLAGYAAKLDCLRIPNQVTGSSLLSDVPELKLLHRFLEAVLKPDDPVALVAVLRSELLGVSDACLYAYKKAGGYFDYRKTLPESLDSVCAASAGDAFDLLRAASRTLSKLPAAAAVERIIEMLGLTARAGSRPGADVGAGSIMKAVEILRSAPARRWGISQLVEYLGEIAGGTVSFDGLSASSSERPAVKIMNLHKAKGLEAPVVFLANPYGESRRDPDFHIERDAETAKGYILVQKQVGDYKFQTIAQPPGWNEVVERERRFTEAENLRLRYVAVTRAGSALVISRKEKRDQYNPWRHFGIRLENAKTLPDPGEAVIPSSGEIEVTPEDIEQAEESIAERLATIREETYDVRRAKEHALSTAGEAGAVAYDEPDRPDFQTGGEHGAEWGTAIHTLLELAMKTPEADLKSAARNALEENGLDPTHADTAEATVRSAMNSGTWKRALASEKVMTEVPFELLLDPEAVKPTILRGAVDLAFREKDGWIIIDYKTDSLDKNTKEELEAKYASQLEIYKRAWEQATGEKVAETGLLFVY
ncbi:MAG: UvrD-helicase domain-containing protein [Actinobacteria bacterium]|nr:UvrD-helicase domain-containing protein [Actinomycetota bacterium]